MLLTAVTEFPTIIRDAKPSDFKALGRLYTSALADNESWKVIWGDVKPEVAQEWLWEGVGAFRTDKGIDTIRILERIDTHKVIGVIWFSEAKDEGEAEFWKTVPEGFNKEELQKLLIPTEKWHAELLQYGNYTGEYVGGLPRRFSLLVT